MYAVEFSPVTLELGEEHQVQESVRTEDKFASQFAVARNTGTLVYLAGNFGGLGEEDTVQILSWGVSFSRFAGCLAVLLNIMVKS